MSGRHLPPPHLIPATASAAAREKTLQPHRESVTSQNSNRQSRKLPRSGLVHKQAGDHHGRPERRTLRPYRGSVTWQISSLPVAQASGEAALVHDFSFAEEGLL